MYKRHVCAQTKTFADMMSSVYVSGLDLLAQRRYLQKRQVDEDVFPDPYGIVESA